MKPLKTDTSSHSLTHTAPPLNPQQFPLHAQMDATTGRDNVRKAAHVHVPPRQSQRPAERSK